MSGTRGRDESPHFLCLKALTGTPCQVEFPRCCLSCEAPAQPLGDGVSLPSRKEGACPIDPAALTTMKRVCLRDLQESGSVLLFQNFRESCAPLRTQGSPGTDS